MRTQWRTGPTGLDYNVLYRRMDRMDLSPDEYDQLEDDVQVMEMEALATIHKDKT
jgi:hypothetical protein